MAIPSDKSEGVTNFLDSLTNRSGAILHNCCVKPPIGCGKSATEFKDELSAREFRISGLCQECQDKFFGG
jgi:hypothetical protein